MEEQIMKYLKDINKKGFQGKLSEKVLIIVTQNFIRFKKMSKDSKNLKKDVREYLKKVLVQSIKKNEGLQHRLLVDFIDIYDTINEERNITPSIELFDSFCFICVDSLIENCEKKINKKIIIAKEYSLFIRNSILEKNPEKKEPVQSYVFEFYKPHQKYLSEIISGLEKVEKDKITSYQKGELEKDHNLLLKMEYALRYYPLLRWQYKEYLTRAEKIKMFFKRKKYEQDILAEQTTFLNNLPYPNDIVLSEIKKASYNLQMFLGQIPNQCSYDILERQVNKFIENLKKQDLSEYTIFSHFKTTLPSTVLLLYQCFKNEYPEYYEIITKKYGKNLQEFYILSEKEENILQLALQKMQELLEQEKTGQITLDKEEFLIYERNIEKLIANLNPSEKQWLIKKVQQWSSKTLQNKCEITDEYLLKYSVNKLKMINFEYYQAIINVHGTDLKTYKKENTNQKYYQAVNELKNTIKRSKRELEERKAKIEQVKESLNSLTKEERAIIKEKRKGFDTYFLSQKYHKSTENIYELFARHIILFGDQMPQIIREILLNCKEGANYLMASKTMASVLSNMSPKEILKWKRELCNTTYISQNMKTVKLKLRKEA